MCVAKTFSFTQIHSQFIVFFIFVICPRGIFTHQSRTAAFNQKQQTLHYFYAQHRLILLSVFLG